jgi:low affinity Fe/Cu permease
VSSPVDPKERAGPDPVRSTARTPSVRVLKMSDRFRQFAAQASSVLGSPWTFVTACAFVIGWALAGPYFAYSNGWQLLINTSTTIATFLMVFLLQATQNRDTKAINIKLDELLRAIEGARTGLADLSELSDEEVERLEHELIGIARKAGVSKVAADADPHASR